MRVFLGRVRGTGVTQGREGTPPSLVTQFSDAPGGDGRRKEETEAALKAQGHPGVKG